MKITLMAGAKPYAQALYDHVLQDYLEYGQHHFAPGTEPDTPVFLSMISAIIGVMLEKGSQADFDTVLSRVRMIALPQMQQHGFEYGEPRDA